jgi:hypothetical protein
MTNHLYTPILRAKRSEWAALRDIENAHRARMIPLMELPRDLFVARINSKTNKLQTPNPNGVLQKFSLNLQAAASKYPIWFDLGHFGATGFTIGELNLWKRMKSLLPRDFGQIVATVRSGLDQSQLLAARELISHLGSGVCIRVAGNHLTKEGSVHGVFRELNLLGLRPDDTDLVVDLSDDPGMLSHRFIRTDIAEAAKWRTLTVVAGTFPKDLMNCRPDQQVHFLPRLEWSLWWAQRDSSRNTPVFGDYTTQHSVYSDAPSIRGSISVRYTLETRYMVLRGYQPDSEKNRTYDQFKGHGILLCASEHYFGRSFSSGDRFIYERTQKGYGPGNAGQWRAAGINHHMTLTIEQLLSTDGTSKSARERVTPQVRSFSQGANRDF